MNIKIADFGFSKSFISLDHNKINFNSSDAAVAQMNGQFFSGRQIRVEYAVFNHRRGRLIATRNASSLDLLRVAPLTSTHNFNKATRWCETRVLNWRSVKPSDKLASVK